MFNNITPVVKGLIIVNVIFFIGTDFLTANSDLKLYLVEWIVEHPNFQFWQPVTSTFVHFGFSHLLFNMFGLLVFGPPLERWAGSNKFLFYYLACGIGANVIGIILSYFLFQFDVQSLMESGQDAVYAKQLLLNTKYNSISAGASGSVYGVVAGFAYLFPNRKLIIFPIPMPIQVKWLALALFGYALLATFGIVGANDNVGHEAHLAGAILGFIMIWYWKKNSMDQYRWD